MEKTTRHAGKPPIGAERSRAAQSPAVSQRVTTKLLKVARACGIERYEIIFEMNGQVRLSVGSAQIADSCDAEPNDFDRDFR